MNSQGKEFSAEFATDLQFNNKLQLEVEMSIIYSPRECPVSVWVKYTIVQKPEWIIIKAKDNLGRQPFISSHYLIYLDHYPSSSQLTILLCAVFVLLNIILPLTAPHCIATRPIAINAMSVCDWEVINARRQTTQRSTVHQPSSIICRVPV